MRFNTLKREIEKTEQNVNYTEIGEAVATSLRYRIRIRSNSYKFQCSAVIEVWSTPQMAWSDVAHIGTGAMLTRECLYVVNGGVGPEAFAKDRDELLRRFALVLEVTP